MEHIVDARGYSCPQPVIMTMSLIDKITKGSITILVDTAVSKENVIRAVHSRGWKLDSIDENEEGYRIVVSRP